MLLVDTLITGLEMPKFTDIIPTIETKQVIILDIQATHIF